MGRLTVANMGPEKKPIKLTATEAATMLGTLKLSVLGTRRMCGWGNSQPKDKLESKHQHGEDEDHPSLPEPVYRLS